jgi:hypothetical protein
MPGSTLHGYPYAEPTDPLVQWPGTSQSLAEQIDTQIAGQRVFRWSGIVTPPASGEVTVDLSAAGFTQEPVICVSNDFSVVSESDWRWIMVAVRPSTATQANLMTTLIAGPGAGTVPAGLPFRVHLIAVGP